MTHAVLVYLHLLATCAAIGTIVVTDLRLLAKAMGYRVVIPPPHRLETRIVAAALVVLYLTGAVIVWRQLALNPDYLTGNPKLQAKLLLVAALTLNALLLHRGVFPILARSRPVSAWSWRERLIVAPSVSLSNALWLFCAFLGVARPWNGTVSLIFVLGVAVAAWAGLCLAVMAVLALAARDEPRPEPDWIDSVKASISGFAGLGER